MLYSLGQRSWQCRTFSPTRKIDIQLGTLNKALASQKGGFVAEKNSY